MARPRACGRRSAIRLRTLATPKAVLSSMGQMAQMKMTKMAEMPLSLMV